MLGVWGYAMRMQQCVTQVIARDHCAVDDSKIILRHCQFTHARPYDCGLRQMFLVVHGALRVSNGMVSSQMPRYAALQPLSIAASSNLSPRT